ncbi:MAG: bifunctional diguanylate cyclase/phosphodiesterase, partial [Thiotrichaceae bacterium]|nr:bifunctional diguanylate cyclase/phosphodiesterase [Thiotrichaceae bacterium]
MTSNKQYIYTLLHKHTLIMLGLSLIPGLGYILLAWINNHILPALIWYGLIVVLSIFGYQLYKEFNNTGMDHAQVSRWYKKLRIFYYLIFCSWALIFILYATETKNHMNYIAIFTEIGAAVVATTLLYSDKKICKPILFILLLPLSFYFFLIHELYGYILALFTLILLGVLFYSANSSAQLLAKSNYQATHDQLTGMNNRHAFVSLLQQKINFLSQNDKFSYLLLIDLDHFKTINDSLGHDVGDEVLQEVSIRLKNIAAQQNVIARLGGDEFIFLGQNFADKEECLNIAHQISEQLLISLKSTYYIRDHHLYISASIGVSLLKGPLFNANAFIKEADIAMYEVKARGRDGVILFNDELSRRVVKNLSIEQMLHFALEKNEISLNYQPQLNRDKKVIGCEVLVRWQNKEFGFVPPDVFIPIAEQTGYMVELGDYIVEESLKTFQQWDEQGIILDQFSINISMRQFFHYNFIENIKGLCKKYLHEKLQKKLIFEMTETLLAEDIPKVISIMQEIRDTLGIRFSMDDFGTGYSSLSYLQQMPIDELKIDRSFISKLTQDNNDQKMVHIILIMAKTFDLKVVAEGVETAEQFQFLVDNKCDTYQGYHFSKALIKEDFEKF